MKSTPVQPWVGIDNQINTPNKMTLSDCLRGEVEGEVYFDRFSRGRYATDASFYQIMPVAVVVPWSINDVETTLQIAQEHETSVLPRGGGTSQCGQTVNRSIVLDNSRYLNKIVELDLEADTVTVEPGLVLDQLNTYLKPHGRWFPVDVSTSSRATIGGMTANNSCGSRSIRYGTMRDNVVSIRALLADGQRANFGPLRLGSEPIMGNGPTADLFHDLLDLGRREEQEIGSRFPDVLRRIGGYNIDALLPAGGQNNLSHLLVGSEGTLAFFENITVQLSPLPRNRVLGVCHFPSFHAAMDSAQHIVELDPVAVELIDRTMIDLALDIDMFRPVVEQFVRGEPAALLLVEFAEPDPQENLRRLSGLVDLISQLGFAWDHPANKKGGVVEATDSGFQSAIWEVRKQGLNIMMSMKSEGKPVSFVEDCAVHLSDLAEYTHRLTDLFHQHGTDGTWYAHASVGTLHVRPVLNLKQDQDVRSMRSIAEAAFDMVREYRGSHSGEHGDGIVRSEFHSLMFGERMVRNFEWVKDRFDPNGIFNPGKIVRPPKMDDRSLFRYPENYDCPDIDTVLDWSQWTGKSGGFQGAIEMCNNNGACRKFESGVMCPSFRVTRNEKDLVRGRANTLRLALSGQLGPGALTSDDMWETMKLCVSCKGCKRECPAGVDMSRMKIEVLSARAKLHGIGLHEKTVAWLPRYAPWLSRVPQLANLRNRIPFLASLSEKLFCFSSKRELPKWRSDWFRDSEVTTAGATPDVVVLVDTFSRYFEPENVRTAVAVLQSAGYEVAIARPANGSRPLCCGRTFLSAGLVDQARLEARRLIDALIPFTERGIRIIGLEPSCLLTLRDEFGAMLPQQQVTGLASNAVLLEEFIAAELDAGRLRLSLKPASRRAYVHGHCHQKAFNTMAALEKTLSIVPDLDIELIDSSCCGMAGAFGYHKDNVDVSNAMAEESLFPTVRRIEPGALLVANGTSCRHHIAGGTGRSALHVARVLHQFL